MLTFPHMSVSNSRIVERLSSPRRPRVIRCIGDESPTDLGKHLLIHISCWECRLQPIVWIWVFDIITSTEELGKQIIFVVATPGNDGRMVAKAFDVIFDLLRDLFPKIDICRVCPAGKHEVIPDHDSKLIADVVKDIIFIDGTTPSPMY
jgi:hypothetical protein